MPAELETSLRNALSVYEVPNDDLVGEVIIPAMEIADDVRIGAGFFSSHCLAQIAPGLAAYIAKSDQVLRLLISPEISSADRDAIGRGLRSPQQVIEECGQRLLEGAAVSESALVHHTLDCLAYLVATNRLELRFILMKAGMYHKKLWLFKSGEVCMAVHGSGNATARGLLVNGEQMTIDRPWMDGASSKDRVDKLTNRWMSQWNNEDDFSLAVTASQGLSLAGRKQPKSGVPTVQDFWDAWQADNDAGIEVSLPPSVGLTRRLLRVPPDIEWRSGAFAHQGRAVDRFMEEDGQGILAIATGGGKTVAALIAATQVQALRDGPMVLLILVPTRPLMLQWASMLRQFGVVPLLPSLLSPVQRKGQLEELKAALASTEQRTEVIVATNALFGQDDGLRDFVGGLESHVLAMIIGDEVHNLGVPTFLENLPTRFEKRMGLSATPVRQFDPHGTAALLDFFGPEIFEFSLKDAIEAGCLSPYSYYIHEVHLSPTEMDKYQELTEKLRTAGFAVDDEGQTLSMNDHIARLLRDRRAVLEQAEEKLAVLERLLVEQGPENIRRTLIYTSAKAIVLSEERQIESVIALLTRLGIISHEFTSAETSGVNAKALLEAFERGDYQVLAAMKVLDEGIDIPETDTAYLLASSTVRREWVQRRGRILRARPGKERATIHDFLVVPPDITSAAGKAVLRGELRRANEFAEDAANEWDTEGPRATISKFEDVVWHGGGQ